MIRFLISLLRRQPATMRAKLIGVHVLNLSGSSSALQ